jgi:hypothetical protein
MTKQVSKAMRRLQDIIYGIQFTEVESMDSWFETEIGAEFGRTIKAKLEALIIDQDEEIDRLSRHH